MKHLANTPSDWEEIDLPWVADNMSTDIGDNGRTRRAMQFVRFTPRSTPYKSNSLIEMHSTWENYLAGLDRKVRHELRRNLRRINDYGNVEFVRHRPGPQREGDGDPRWDLFDECEEVSRASWQADSANGNTLCHPNFRDFYRDAHAAATKLGMVDLALLKLDGSPVAFSYNYHYQDRVFGLRMGYDQSAGVKGLGTALLSHVVRDGFDRGDRCLELGVGEEHFKQRLRTCVQTSCRLTYTPVTSWRPQVMRASRWLRRLAVG
ncbi:MAG: GNAT family N-acetyltransferase, partial [Aeoliella sp.]